MKSLVLAVASAIPMVAVAQRFQDLCQPLEGFARIKCIELQQQQAQQKLQLHFEQQKQREAQKDKRDVQKTKDATK